MVCWYASSPQMVSVQELELLEAELQSALQQGRADPFVAFLYGVILSDRRGPAPSQTCSCCGNLFGRGDWCYANGAELLVRPLLAQPRIRDCRERRAEARAALVQCLHGYPCNWAAWLALANVSGGAEFERASDPGQACVSKGSAVDTLEGTTGIA